MTEPLVCAVMLTRDRPEMARRAVDCFRRQTYGNKRLVVYDVSPELITPCGCNHRSGEWHWYGDPGKTIGWTRNAAVAIAEAADIICHWDDDDVSHPQRIAEQVALLQSSGADCVGYRDMLFADSRKCLYHQDGGTHEDESQTCRCDTEAWLYSHSHPRYALGTSLCYWRKAWERVPFANTSRGEDCAFVSQVDTVGVSSFAVAESREPVIVEARMVATIHGGNTSDSYGPESMGKPEWKRVPEWDDYVRKVIL